MPDDATEIAQKVSWEFYFIYWICVAAFVGVMGAMIYFVIRYRASANPQGPGKAPHHSTALELTWTFIPAALMVAMFWFNFRTYVEMSTIPQGNDVWEITVTGKTWNWDFGYDAIVPGAQSTDVLYLPKGRTVRLRISSNDVIHSFFVPVAKVKKDAVPGRYNYMWLRMNQLPEFREDQDLQKDPEPYYNFYCAEYCGRDHSTMVGKVVVLEEPDFKKRLQDIANELNNAPLDEIGQRTYEMQCAQCHVIEGPPLTGGGPTFENLYKYEQPLEGGGKILADENYIRESIQNPKAKIHEGYGNIKMPAFPNLTERELEGLILFIKMQSDRWVPPVIEREDEGEGEETNGEDTNDDAAPNPADQNETEETTNTENDAE